MNKSQNKVRLSPRLKQGVGRGYSKNNLLKYSGFVFLFISAALFIYTGAIVIKNSGNKSTSESNPQVLGATDTQQPNPFLDYTVQKGDTVFNIAQKYNINWATLATINNLSSPFTLKPGEIIKIPNQ